MTEYNLFLTKLPQLMKRRKWKKGVLKGGQSWIYSGSENYCEIQPLKPFPLKDKINIRLMPSFGKHDFKNLGEEIFGKKYSLHLISCYTDNTEKYFHLEKEVNISYNENNFWHKIEEQITACEKLCNEENLNPIIDNFSKEQAYINITKGIYKEEDRNAVPFHINLVSLCYIKDIETLSEYDFFSYEGNKFIKNNQDEQLNISKALELAYTKPS